MAKYPKAASATIEKLKAELKAAKAAAAAKVKSVKAKAKAEKPAKKPKIKKAKQVFSAGDWTGAAPKKLTIYKVRLMLDEQQIGFFGPYATIRAASADAKNILRMHVGPNHKIEEIGVDEPLLRSDGNVKVYFHPSVYSAQATDKGVLTAQVIEQGGEAQRTKTFVKKYNPAGAYLYDYNTAERLRKATKAEQMASKRAAKRDGGAGVIVCVVKGTPRHVYAA